MTVSDSDRIEGGTVMDSGRGGGDGVALRPADPNPVSAMGIAGGGCRRRESERAAQVGPPPARLEAAFDLERLEMAEAGVRSQVEPHTREAFRLTALEDLSGADAAARLGTRVVTVFKAKRS